jgi:hypothetical protein
MPRADRTADAYAGRSMTLMKTTPKTPVAPKKRGRGRPRAYGKAGEAEA